MLLLVTGATGFIGSNVLTQLMATNHSVRVLALPETLGQLSYANAIETVPGSLSNPKSLMQATAGVDVVLHLAGINPGSPLPALWAVNVNGTRNLLKAAVAQKVGRFVLLSSVGVYRAAPFPFMWPIRETFPRQAHGLWNFRNYAQSKISAENLVLRTHALNGIEYVIVRPPVVYGASRPSLEAFVRGIMSRPMQAISRDLPYPHLQWVHVKDLAHGLVLAGTLMRAANEIFNIAGAELFSLRDLVELVATTHPLAPGVALFVPPPPPWPGNNIRYSYQRAALVMGYLPQVSLQAGIREVVTAMHGHQPQFW
jgi:nucleoside-diphosphate-sugar epimerase